MILIGLTGFRRSGKDTVCGTLVRHFGFEQHGFADALRKMAYAINPVISIADCPPSILVMLTGSIGRLHSQQKKEWRYRELFDELGYDRAKDIPDFRAFLQHLGTEGIRGTFGPNAWVDALERSVSGENAVAKVAVSDVRFHSEANWILQQGGVLWRVNRPGVGGNDPHPSEVDIPYLPAHRDLLNKSTLDDLERAVIDAAQFDLPLLLEREPTNNDSSGACSPGA